MTYIILLLNLFAVNFIHVGQVAEYYFTLNEKHLQMKFIIDKAELINFNFNDDCNIKDMTALCTANYIGLNSFIKINGEKVEMEIGDSYTENGHLIIFFNAELLNGQIHEISIKNHCFYEFDSDYKNRIIIDLDRFHRSYLLTGSNDQIHLK